MSTTLFNLTLSSQQLEYLIQLTKTSPQPNTKDEEGNLIQTYFPQLLTNVQNEPNHQNDTQYYLVNF